MPIISLLSQSSKRGARTIISLRQELSVAKAQSVDVTKFEERRDKFTAEFMKFVKSHKEKHDEAIAAIDKAIADAEKQIDRLRKIRGLLAYGHPTMRAKFEEARRLSSASDTTGLIE